MANKTINDLTAKLTPVTADEVEIWDTEAASPNRSKKSTMGALASFFRSVAETLTNKTFDLASNTLTGTLAEFNTALQSESFASLGGAETFTGAKTFNQLIQVKGSDAASAATLAPDFTSGNYFDVTGTTTITAITVSAGTVFWLQFDGALTLTHHATNLDLPGEANITTAAGDVATFFATGSNTVQCTCYTKADGTALVGSGVTDHGALTGLSDDDHTQYALVDGTRAFTGSISIGNNAIEGQDNHERILFAADLVRHYVRTSEMLKLSKESNVANITVNGGNGGGSGSAFRITASGNTAALYLGFSTEAVGIGSDAVPTANPENVLFFKEKTADPTMDTDTCGVYGKLDTGKSHVFVIDEDSNATKISPHNAEGEWEFFSRNTRTGRTVRINMERAVRVLERLSGETLIEETFEQ